MTAETGRPATALTRRDVARALLQAPATDATAALPGLRRQLIAAGNPLSSAFWDSAATMLQRLADGDATEIDVERWLETTGTEPAPMIGMLVWDDEDERGPVQTEVYGLLVDYLEGLVTAGLIDPDRLVTGGVAVLREHRRLQEEWMVAPLPDGRVPMSVVTDEVDEEFLAEWDAAEAEALSELREVLTEVADRPVPHNALQAACGHIRAILSRAGWPGALLIACGGVNPRRLPGDDAELWLTLASGIVSPREDLERDAAAERDADGFEDLTEDEQSMVALCALDHNDWLAATSALAKGGPGTPASADDLAGYVGDYDPDDFDDQADAAASMFLPAVGLLQVIGAVDDDDRLTPLGWWGIPEAVQRAWEPGA